MVLKFDITTWGLRSFTLKDPHDGKGGSIGVVLYQKAFFVGKANHNRAVELLGREPYPTGGVTVGWETGVEAAFT